MKLSFKDFLFTKNNTIKEALKKLDETGEKCLVVVDKNTKLLGTLSDGDIRKALLKGFTLNQSINDIFNDKPTYVIENLYDQGESHTIGMNDPRFGIFNKSLIPLVDGKFDSRSRIIHYGQHEW